MTVNPKIKPRVLVTARSFLFERSSSKSAPVIYIMYAGIIGSKQGEKKDKTPAPKAIGKDTSVVIIFTSRKIRFILYYTPLGYWCTYFFTHSRD
jgi:hypothetical protein